MLEYCLREMRNGRERDMKKVGVQCMDRSQWRQGCQTSIKVDWIRYHRSSSAVRDMYVRVGGLLDTDS